MAETREHDGSEERREGQDTGRGTEDRPDDPPRALPPEVQESRALLAGAVDHIPGPRMAGFHPRRFSCPCGQEVVERQYQNGFPEAGKLWISGREPTMLCLRCAVLMHRLYLEYLTRLKSQTKPPPDPGEA